MQFIAEYMHDETINMWFQPNGIVLTNIALEMAFLVLLTVRKLPLHGWSPFLVS